MSGKQDDWQYVKPSAKALHVQESIETSSKEKGDYYNLSVATFTFGGRQVPQAAPQEKEKDTLDANIPNMNFRKNNASIMKQMTNPEEKEITKDRTNEIKNRLAGRIIESTGKSDNNFVLYTSFINKIGSHNSFLGVVVHTIWNMKMLRSAILNEMLDISEKDIRTKVLWHLRNILFKYPDRKKIDISKLRQSFAELFQNRRKFMIDQPDDPVDCYFAVINNIHSHFMKTSPCDVTDDSCKEKCFSHKYLWIDLARIEECECHAMSKRLFSNHHYIFDIPLDKIFELCHNTNLVELNKSFKLKTGNFSTVGTSEVSSIGDLKGKLFLYFKLLLNLVKGECPVNSTRCKFNKTQKILFLANNPSYLAFSLQRGNLGTGQTMSITDNLKTFALIPKIFDLSTLFEYSSKQKKIFEFFGCIMIKPSKTYTCVFKTLIGNESSWVYYNDENVMSFASSMEFIAEMLKNGDTPVIIFYQIQEKYTDIENEITVEEYQLLERYARNADSLGTLVQNRIRINEDIIKYDMMLLESEPPVNTLAQNRNPNRNNNVSSKTSTTISTSKNNSMNNNSNSKFEQINEYTCHNCSSKNRIECVICIKCGSSNEDVIEDILRKRQSNMNVCNNVIPEKNEEERSTLNSRKTASMKNGAGAGHVVAHVNPFSKAEGSSTNHNDIEDSENENDGDFPRKYKGKNMNMPKQITPKKDTSAIVIVSKNDASKADVTKQYEDRIRPVVEAKQNNKVISPTILNSVIATPENWICETCHTANKAYEYKCKCCKTINTPQRELIENIISNNHKAIEKAKEADPTFNHPNSNAYSNYNTIKSPIKDEKKSGTQDKKSNEKKESKVIAESTATATYENPSNQNASNTLKRPICICFTNYNESVIRNNLCTLCNRHVDCAITNENTIKKRYQQEIASKPSIVVGNSNSTANIKPNSSKSNLKKDDNSQNNQQPKIGNTPLIQGNINCGKKMMISHMRYNNVDTAEDESLGGNLNNNLNNYNPFPNGIKISKITQLEGEGQYNPSQYKSNPSGPSARIQSVTSKKKSIENIIGQQTNPNSKLKK